MAVTLKRLLADSKNKYDIELIAGATGTNNLVRWVHIVEDADVPSFLHGNELIFTTGIGIASKKNFNFITFAQGLINHGSSGWVINIGPYIPSIPEELIDFCNKKEFPLYTIPWVMRLIDVTYDLSHKIIENEERENSISKSFSNLIYKLGDLEENVDILLRGGYKATDTFRIIAIKAKQKDGLITSDMLVNNLFNLEASISTVNKYSIIIENDILIVLTANTSDIDLENLLYQIQKGLEKEYNYLSFNIGISDNMLGLDNLYKLYNEALTASKTSVFLNKKILTYSECGIYQLIYSIDDIDIKKRYVRDVLGPIIEYDEKNNTNYLSILKLYLEHDCGIQEISEILGVHRNTINYKIKFIKDNFKLNLDMKDAAKFWLAFSIKKVLENMNE